MVRQTSLDSWQVRHLTDLLRRGSILVHKTREPIVLYRQTMEEQDGSYEEAVCTLAGEYVIEQLVVSGGVLPPAFREQLVFPIQDYPERLLRTSRDRFLEVAAVLEERLR